ncbi:WD repeat-containing protein 36-like [Lineus longissimus]|uniref:WD repeat-containing protein 36-like n=1 Tax=Lineus longissimus TaxID=88925 RepID=UPI002B4C7017
MPLSSKIFSGFRALGFCSNHVPLCVRYHSKHQDNYVVTCVGKAFHTYNCSKLGIVSVSNSHPEDISCLATDALLVFTACKNVVRAFARGRQVVHTYEGHEKDVHLLLPFGNHLISVDEDSCLKIWDIRSEELYLEIAFNNESFEITSVVHPSTYLNKIVIGSRQGSMQLWNIKTNKQIFTFPGWGQAITVMEQAPAIDVMAIGLADGQIILHNLKFDETLMKFTQDWGPVTTIAFRTDGEPIMATGSAPGHIALWNLEKRRLLCQMRESHSGAVTGMKCLPSEPLMVTSSSDNSIKIWIFDKPDGAGRLLRERSGHGAPPNKIRFHGNSGKTILSAAQDSTLRSFSTVHERLNRSLGRASFNKAKSKKTGLKLDQHMMPPITDFASEMSRQSDWDCIIATHRGLRVSTTWNYDRSTMGKYKPEHDRFSQSREYNKVVARCVTITSCGNFGLIGYSSGHVDTYNMQSGLYRGSYGKPTAHSSSVRGLAVDGLNQVTVTAGADKLVKFWKFKKKEFLSEIKMEDQISQVLAHRESSMLAVALDDFSVALIDIDTRNRVRGFSGHSNRITDMAFSPDSRWLITSSMDATVRTWDVPTGRLIDCFMVDAAVTSMAMSSSGEFLATTHVDDLGIYLWSNNTLYSHVALRPLPSDYEPEVVTMPTTRRKQQKVEGEEDGDDADEEEFSDFKSPEQISDELVTLSLLPNSRWQNLLNLDVIKARNKPKEPPKVPKAAPFFLPTIAGLEPKFAKPVETTDETPSRVLPTNLMSYTDLGKLLHGADKPEDYEAVLNKLKECGPSMIDMEIRSLSPEGGGSVHLMSQFMKLIEYVLSTNKNFELAQAYVGLFLKVHTELIAAEPDLLEMARKLSGSQLSAWTNLQNTFNQTLCLINYLKSATV